ncbi:MAG: type IV secretion system family protein [Gammaproteobacteria bacterium]|nr:MAG: type IV secretion system family protein [Gammaproteobacteria bacterium]
MAKREIGFALTVLLLLTATPAAQAQFAVIDVASLTQLMSQVSMLEQQLATAQNQLTEARAQFQAMTGGRSMERLLGATARNYLPASWGSLESAQQGAAGAYPGLATDLGRALAGVSVLSPAQVAALSPQAAAQLRAQRQSAALLEALTHEALANSSSRFAAIQQLIDAIARAGDQKAILDLQARIAAELGMLQNEQTKLQALYQSAEAQQWADAQRLGELTIAAHGQFETRFQPHP